MYARYVYKASATAAAVAGDLAALATGAAVSSLSSACDKAQTTVAGEASGWAMYDAAGLVMRAPTAAGWMYARVEVTGGSVGLRTMEGWSGGAPVNASALRVAHARDATYGGVCMLYAVPQCVAVASANVNAWAAVAEVAAESPLLAGGRPLSVVCSGDVASGSMPRIKAPAADGDVLAASVAVLGPQGASIIGSMRTDAGVVVPVVPCYLSYGGAFVGRALGLYRAGDSSSAIGDLLDDGGTLYAHLRGSSATSFAVPRR